MNEPKIGNRLYGCLLSCSLLIIFWWIAVVISVLLYNVIFN